jgi:predicted O-methyltransferase YrrM
MTNSLPVRGLRFAARWAAAASAAVLALTVGVASRRHRRLVATLARHIGYDDHPARMLPRIRVEAVTSNDTQVVLPDPLGIEGNISLLELLVLSRLVQERAPRTIFEIGTFDGRTTLALAANAPGETAVYTLDLPASQPPALALDPAERALVDKPASGTRVRGPAGAKVRQLYGDTATFDFTPYACDLIFVDASHAYDYVLNDSRKALTMLRSGRGVIVWHDYGEWEGVTRALNELSREAAFEGLRHVEGTTLAVLER